MSLSHLLVPLLAGGLVWVVAALFLVPAPVQPRKKKQQKQPEKRSRTRARGWALSVAAGGATFLICLKLEAISIQKDQETLSSAAFLVKALESKGGIAALKARGHLEPLLLEQPGFAEWKRARQAETGIPDQMQDRFYDLGLDGLSRLDDPSLLAFAALELEIDQSLDELTCADLATDILEPGQLEAIAGAALPPEKVASYYQFLYDAGMARLREAPVPTVTPQEREDAIDAAIARLSAEDGKRFRDDLHGTPREKSDREICWMMRTLYRQVGELPAVQGVHLARAFLRAP